MPDMYFDVDVAITECPVNLLPLLDATDYRTIEDAVAYNAAGMALYWHFCTSAGAYTVTAVTPTTAGNYDWTDQGAAGIYTIEIPASGGASINNDTEGYGWFTGVATGVLPWRGPVIGFRAAAINDALMDGGDNLDVNTVQWLGTACATPTVAGVPEVDLTHVAGATTNVSSLATNVDAILTDTADMQPKLGTPAGASISADLLVIDNFVDGIESSLAAGVTVTTNNDKTGYALSAAGVDAIWDESLAAHQTALTAGRALTLGGVPIAETTATGTPTTSSIQLTAGSTTDGFYEDQTLVIASGTGAGQARIISTYTGATRTCAFDEPFTAAPAAADALFIKADHVHPVSEMQAGLATAAALAVVDDFLDTEIAAIKAKTDSLTFTVAGQVDSNIQSINDVAITGDGGVTPFNV